MKNKLSLILILELLLSSASLSQWGWFQVNSGLSSNINDMTMLNYNIWEVGDNGKIITTSNNGANWSAVTSGTAGNLNAVKFARTSSCYDCFRGYIACSNGIILRTTTSGVVWNLINTGSTQKLNDVTELNDTLNVIAVGDNGTILKSTNQGLTWVSKNSTTTNNLNGIIEPYSNFLIAVGAGGTILISFSDGESWMQAQSSTTNNLNSIDANGYYFGSIAAAGDGGTVIKTTNGGYNWSVLPTGTTQNLKKIRILDTYINQWYTSYTYFFATGANGTIITSTNLGENWETRSVPVTSNLNSIYFLNMNTGLACGNGGTMLKTVSNHFYIVKKRMDANNIGSWFTNDGGFNRFIDSSVGGFEFPRGSGKLCRYASGLDIGAIVEGDTLVSISYHGHNEYYPGYTFSNGYPHGRNDSNYRIYKLITGVNNTDRLKWPNVILGNSDQGAPVYYDNSTSSWKPLDFGTQTMFSVFTDSYSEAHTLAAGSTNPLKADVKHLSFALDSAGVLANVLFSQFTIINRSPFVWHDAYITLWTDDDVGDAGNDKVGCDSLLRLGYTYNGTAEDTAYGYNSPAVGFLLLRGAIVPTGNNSDTLRVCSNKTRSYLTGVRDLGMTVFNFAINMDPNDPDPESYYCAYRLMKGLNIYGYNRYHPMGYQTTLVYTGNPDSNTGWNQADGNDMRSYLSTGPLNMNPGDTQIIVFAQVVGRGTSSWNSVTVLKQYCASVKQFYDSCYTFIPNGVKNQNEVAYQYSLSQNYPNPFNPKTKIVFTVPKRTLVKLEIYDVAGRLVGVLADMNFDMGRHSIEWDGTNYSSGVYFYKLSVFDASAPLSIKYSETKKMVLVK